MTPRQLAALVAVHVQVNGAPAEQPQAAGEYGTVGDLVALSMMSGG